MELDLDFGVAHVTFNALKLGKYAGCIVSLVFVLDVYFAPIHELEIDSTYNTYLNLGPSFS